MGDSALEEYSLSAWVWGKYSFTATLIPLYCCNLTTPNDPRAKKNPLSPSLTPRGESLGLHNIERLIDGIVIEAEVDVDGVFRKQVEYFTLNLRSLSCLISLFLSSNSNRHLSQYVFAIHLY